MAYEDMGFNNPYNTLGGYMQQQPQYYQQVAPQPIPQQQQLQGATGGSGFSGDGMGQVLGGGIQGAVGIVDWIKGAKEFKKYKKESEQALAGLPQYTTSQYAQQALANAQANANAINPATMAMYNQLQKGAANTAAVGQRNAMSGGEAINAAIQGQEMAQNQMPQIAQQQMAYEMANRNQLNNALAAMAAEQMNEFNSKNAIQNQMLNYKMGLMGAAAKRKSDGINNTVGGVSNVYTGVQGMMKDAVNVVKTTKGGV